MNDHDTRITLPRITLPRLLLLALLLSLLAGCRGLGQTPPPPPLDIEARQTAIYLTENAPPPGLDRLTLPAIDRDLQALAGYRYTFELRFSGSQAGSGAPVEGAIQVQAWWDGFGRARRVVLDAAGAAFVAEPRFFEGVRIGDTYYLVDGEGRCLTNVEDTAETVAALDVGGLVGGISGAPYSQQQATLNGQQSYRYDVGNGTIAPPVINLLEGTALNIVGELWYAPQFDAVTRCYANIDVSNARLFESALPVSGQLIIRYDAYEFGTPQNVSIPFGC